MALQVWLPLNRDLKNQGLLKLPNFSFNNLTQQTDGKIGKCYKGQAIYHFAEDFLDNQWSLCCWVKASSWGQYNDIILCKNSSTSTECQFYFSIVGGNTLNIGINGGSSTASYSYTFATNTWYHIAATYNGTTYTLYLNGEQKKTGTYSSTKKTGMNNLGIGCRSNDTNGTTGTGNNSGMKLNDVRIYNHCLSVKEVKEIAKGLVLHYPLNDRFCEATTNLVTSITAGGQTTVVNNIITTSGQNKDTYFTLNLSENITNGTQYTIQCIAEMPVGTTWTFPIGVQSNSTLSWVLKPGYNEYTFTANDISWGNNRIFLDDLSGSARSSGIQCKFYNFQVEKKDHATGFAGYGVTRTTGVIYDSSGYNNNGTITGSLIISTPSARYECATYISSGDTNYITTPTLNLPGDQITMNFWFRSSNKTPGSNYHMPLEAIANSNQAYEMSIHKDGYLRGGLVVSGTRKVDNCTSTKLLDGNWHMCSMTYDGATIKRYVDGVMEKSTSTTGTLVTSTQFILGHYGSNTSYCCKEANISDVRIYVTALPENEIKKLYNTSMIIDNQGNTYARELVE